MISQLNPSDFAAWRDSAQAATPGSPPVVLDVREPWELQTASVKEDGFRLVHIPMREIPARLAELQEAGGNGHQRPGNRHRQGRYHRRHRWRLKFLGRGHKGPEEVMNR